MQVSIDLADFTRLMAAAEFGVAKAKGFKAEYVVQAWQKSFDKLNAIPLDDGRTQPQRDQAAHDAFADDCAKHGSN